MCVNSAGAAIVPRSILPRESGERGSAGEDIRQAQRLPAPSTMLRMVRPPPLRFAPRGRMNLIRAVEQPPGDDLGLDFGGAFENIENARIA